MQKQSYGEDDADSPNASIGWLYAEDELGNLSLSIISVADTPKNDYSAV